MKIGHWISPTVAAVSLLLLLSGCGDPSGVQGTITLDGQPLETGSILFDPVETPGTKMAARIEGGRYRVEMDHRPKPGKYRVEIRSPKPTGKQIPVEDDPPNTTIELKETVPAKYNTKSELTVTINSGSDTHDFALTTK